MDYQKVYNQIIERGQLELEYRKEKKEEGEYFEGHHIIPTCLGGKGLSSDWNHPNIVPLTAREHFIVHWLLARLHGGVLWQAFWWMCYGSTNTQERYTPSSRVIAEMRENRVVTRKHRENLSKALKGRKKLPTPRTTRDKISTALKGAKKPPRSKAHSEAISKSKTGGKASLETKQKMREAKLGKTHKQESIEKMKKPKRIAQCPFCNKVGGVNLMNRWHFTNCREK